MPRDEERAWQRMRAAVLRCRAEPSDDHLADVRRYSDELVAAMAPDTPAATQLALSLMPVPVVQIRPALFNRRRALWRKAAA